MGEYYGVRMKDDPDGEYLQHWGIPKGFMREGHKYLARLVTPSGYRYLYTQAQVAAAKAGRAIGNAIGLNQRNRAQQATARAQRISGGNKGREQSVQGIKRARMAKSTAKRAQSAYNKTLLGRAEKAFNSARKGISDAASGAQKAFNDAGRYASKQARKLQRNVSRTAQNVGKAVGDATGYNQRQNAQRASARAQRIAGEKTGREQNMTTIKRSRMANKTAKRAQSEYDRTPLGRIEGAFNGARKTASDAVNRPLRNAIGNTATMKRIDQAQAKRGRNTRKENVQQERVASIRGGNTYNDHFNRERPVAAKSRKSWEENTRKKLSGNKKALGEHIPPTTSRRMGDDEIKRVIVDAKLQQMRSANPRKRLRSEIQQNDRYRRRAKVTTWSGAEKKPKVTTWDNVPTKTWDNSTKKEKKIRENVIRENVITENTIPETIIREKKIREKKKRR